MNQKNGVNFSVWLLALLCTTTVFSGGGFVAAVALNKDFSVLKLAAKKLGYASLPKDHDIGTNEHSSETSHDKSAAIGHNTHDAEASASNEHDTHSTSHDQKGVAASAHNEHDTPATSHDQQEVAASAHDEHDAPATSHNQQDVAASAHDEHDAPATSHNQQNVAASAHNEHAAPAPSHDQQNAIASAHNGHDAPATSHDTAATAHEKTDKDSSTSGHADLQVDKHDKSAATHAASGPTLAGACPIEQALSPVAVADKTAREADIPSRMHLNYKDDQFKIVSSKYAINFAPKAAHQMQILGREYRLQSINLQAPSLHTLNGRRYPAELQIVHQDNEGNFDNMAIFIEVGKPNRILGDLLSTVGDIAPFTKFNPIWMFPTSKSYFRYDGSLTSPPCTGGVAWQILRYPINASQEQLQALNKKIGNANPPTIRDMGEQIATFNDLSL